MRTDEDTENDELNRLILTLGKRGKESLRWKQHEGNFWNIMFNPSLEIWSKESGTCLVLQPYGSTAEDLKSEEAYDVGDVDIMIFPDSDHLLIHDEMIEYLPAHPLHVRVKGADHPVLKFCCFKDTSYLCSAALKTPHELIYGDLGDTLGVAFDLISRENPTFTLPYTCHLENSGNSPALKVNFAIPSDDFEPPASLQSSKREWQANSFRFQKQIEDKDISEEVESDGDVNEEIRKGNACLTHTSSKAKCKPFPSKTELASTSEDLTQTLGSDQEKLETKKQPEKLREKKSAMPFFKHLFKKEGEDKEDTFEDSNVKQKQIENEHLCKSGVLAGIDFVPALRSPGWPKVAQKWLEKERKWPSAGAVRKINREGFHLVAKPSKKSGNTDCEFRISFSHAEYLLSQEMNEIQRECYRCLKKFHRAYLSHPKGLVTFHLKSVLLLTMEETGGDMWTENNRAECITKLLWNLFEALTNRHLPHFFVRSYNLFCIDYIEDPDIMESLARKTKQIMEYPVKFAKRLIDDHTRTWNE